MLRDRRLPCCVGNRVAAHQAHILPPHLSSIPSPRCRLRLLPHHAGFGLTLLAAIVIWGANLEYRKLALSDEGRYSEIPRYMAQSGDWMTPRLNGIKYFEKPPLQYWATAAAYDVFGVHHWTARLWPALTGFLGVLLIFFARLRALRCGDCGILRCARARQQPALRSNRARHHARHGADVFSDARAWRASLLALDTRAGATSQRALDACHVGGVRARGAQQRADRHRATGRGHRALYAGQTRFHDSAQAAPRHRRPLFLAICAPWFVAVSLANPEFPWFFFVHEHFQRYTSTIHQRSQPWWYFLPILLAGMLPWTLTLIDALNAARKRLTAAANSIPRCFCCCGRA